MRRRASGLPAGKTFKAWEPDGCAIPPKTQRALQTLEWIDRAEALVICGPSEHFHTALLAVVIVEQSSGDTLDLNPQAFPPSVDDLDGVQLAALDLMQNGLAGTPEPLGGVIRSQVAIGHVGDEPGTNLVGEPDPPRGVRSGLLTRQQSRSQPPVTVAITEPSSTAAWSMVNRLLSGSGEGGGDPVLDAQGRDAWLVKTRPVPVRRPCLLRIAAIC